jgi:sulfur carrier protein ThiS
MKVELKLYASLSRYLPNGAVDHKAVLDVAEGTTPSQLIEDMKLPRESCFLVLVNGIFVPPEERESRTMQEGDALAIWPPIAGG